MPKNFYVRTITAGRYVKSVRYMRSLPGDSDAVRAAKAATTNKAQRFINLKNAAEKLQMLLCANFDEKDACFCTFTFRDEELPVNRKQARQIFRSFLSALRRKWGKQQRQLKYIYTIEGSALSVDPQACPIDGMQWEVRPWIVKNQWDQVDKAARRNRRRSIRLHAHGFLILGKKDRELVRELWPYGHVYINPMQVDLPDTFYKLSYYVTKEARGSSIPTGARSYVPSRNLEQPSIDGHWCEAHETFLPPAEAECVHTANETTDYTSFQYVSYRLPRPKKQPKTYRSKGRLN